MGTATLGVRLLAVLSSLGAAAVFAPVALADFSGGGAAKSDCYVVFEGFDITSGKNADCTDGDPACDTDGACNNSCTFSITACTNGTVGGCTAATIDSITVKNAAITLPATPTADSVCGDPSPVVVAQKLKKNGTYKKGKVKVTVIATAAAGTKPKKDKDKFNLGCLVRTGDCPQQKTTTTTTLPGACCGLPGDLNTTASFLGFATVQGSGTCGEYASSSGSSPIDCSGLYFGGGGNAVPLPVSVPDYGNAISKITSCAGGVATVGAATSAETGSNLNCTDTSCFFGGPLAVPNAGTTPTSTCVLNQLSAPASGSVNCATGASDLSAPLSSIIYLTGDTATDPADAIAGIQPCPLCSNNTCIGGTNNGMACTPGTTALNASYPTSHDCPPDPMFDIGTLPVSFALATGTVTWNGTVATNDTGNPVSVQNRVFSGFCRDANGSGSFAGTTAATARKCWENGMAVGTACIGTFESCEQRNNGAFGPAGGAFSTITVIGVASGSLSAGPGFGTLASIFGIPPTFNATVDAAGDLPGPGAVAIPGTARLCADAMSCL